MWPIFQKHVEYMEDGKMLTIRRTDVRPNKPELDLALVRELRTELPKIFDQVSNEVLANAYSEWSESLFCAGWMMTDSEIVALFLENIELVNENGEVVPFKETK